MGMNASEKQVGGYSGLVFCSCVLFKLFGWIAHSRIFSVFVLHIFLFSASTPLQLTALA